MGTEYVSSTCIRSDRPSVAHERRNQGAWRALVALSIDYTAAAKNLPAISVFMAGCPVTLPETLNVPAASLAAPDSVTSNFGIGPKID